jgi:DNA-binding beta-propeller fold protein YncE
MTYTSTPTSTPSNTYTNTATKTPTNTPTPTCNVYTLAGNGSWGTTDGIGTAASFHNPSGLCVDSSGNIFIADANNHRIRKISSPCAVINGNVSTPAGSTAGYTDATGAAAQFYLPTGVAADASGNVYVADLFNNLIRKITSANVVTTLAGNTVGVPTTNSGSADGTGTSASFYGPSGVCVNAAGTTLYVADTNNNMIRAISLPGGVVTTLAGQVTGGFLDATGTAAKFTNPVDLAVNAAGTTVYVADTGNNRIRYIEVATGVVGTLAGTGAANYVDGIGTIAKFNSPRGIDVDTTTGNIFVADYSNNRIRQITPAGVVTTKAGSGAPGILDGTGSTAQFNSPFGLAVNSSCSPPVIYVSQITGVIIRAIQ